MKTKRNKKEISFIAENDRDRELVKEFVRMAAGPKRSGTGEKILDAAIALALLIPYSQMTREEIATQSKVSPALVSHYLGDMDNIRHEILKEAIVREIPVIIAHGLTLKEPAALAVPDWLKAKAGEAVTCQ